MEIVYAQSLHPLCEGRAFRNPRFFSGAEDGVTAAHVVGDWPRVVEAYRALGVPVSVTGGPPEAPAQTFDPPAILQPVADDMKARVYIPEDWQDLPYNGPADAGITLRSLAALVSDEPVTRKAEAVAAIEAELARREGGEEPEEGAGEVAG